MLIVDIKTGSPTLKDKYQLIAYRELAKNGTNNIDFDKNTHSYSKDGDKIPSVTQLLSVLSDYKYTDPLPAQRGTYIHECTELFDANKLDMEKINLETVGFMTQWQQFLLDNNLYQKKYIAEERYYSKKYNYAGTIDRIYPDAEDSLVLVYLKEFNYKIQVIKYTKEKFHKFLTIMEFNKIKKGDF